MKGNLKYAILFLAMAIMSCSDNAEQGTSNFDRREMLRNMADNLIIPAFEQLNQSAADADLAIEKLSLELNPENFNAVREAWIKLYRDWQYAQPYTFGPAGEQGINKSLLQEIGTFPVNSAGINELISLNDTSFNNFQRDTRGLLTMEYLLYRDNAYELLEQNKNNIHYLKAVSKHIIEKVNPVYNEWKNTYRTIFVEDNSTSIGSSTAIFYNEFVLSYEVFKNFKIAVPLGRKAGQTRSEPDMVECKYSGLSFEYLNDHLTALANIWYGRSRSGEDGVGWREYLAATPGGEALIADTENQIVVLENVLRGLPKESTFRETIISDPNSLQNLVVESQKMTRFFKSDLSSLLGITITFSSGDGD
jgi:predicted lipoprotein